MNRASKAALSAVTLPCAALPLLLGTAVPDAAAAASLIPSGPATVLTHGPTPDDMAADLGGAVCQAPKVCKEVQYDWIQPMGLYEPGVNENVVRLNGAINKTTGPKVVYAFSGGARIASVWLSRYADSKSAPSAQDLSFVLIGNGGRKYGGVNGWFYGNLLATPTDSQYNILDVAREYDPIADFPVNPFNGLALANAAAAFVYVHLRYDEVDLDNPANVVWKEGNTTYVYVPADTLPLTQALTDMGLGAFAATMEPTFRAIIDKAYNRTWLDGKQPQGTQTALVNAALTATQTNAVATAAPVSSARTALAHDSATTTSGVDEKSTRATTNTVTGDSDTGTTETTQPAATPETAGATDGDGSNVSTGSEKTDTTASAGSEPSGTTTPGASAADDAGASPASASGTGKHRAPLFGSRKKDTGDGSAAASSDGGADTSRSGADTTTGDTKTGSTKTDTKKAAATGTETSTAASSRDTGHGSDGGSAS